MNERTVAKEVEMDEAFKEVGEFGAFQKKLLVWFNLFHVVGVYYTLLIAFVGRTPEWNCTKAAASDKNSMCQLYELGKCKPVYSKDFTSIVSEVSE